MPISKTHLPIIFATAMALSVPAWAAAEAAPTQFNELGGVKSWKVGGDTVVFVKNKADQWYRADMKETCMKYDTTKGVNFITEVDPVTNQKVSKVVVARHICLVTSLKKVDSPDVK